MLDKKEILNRILGLKKDHKLSDIKFTQELGIGRNSVYEWTNDKTDSFMRKIPEIAEFFNVSTDYILGNTNDPTPLHNKKYMRITVEDFAISEGLGEENQKKLAEYIKLLKLDEMQKRNFEIADEISIRE